jgi:hypothetical protein
VPRHRFDVTGYAELLVIRNGEAMEFFQRLIVGDRIDPLFAVFPIADV